MIPQNLSQTNSFSLMQESPHAPDKDSSIAFKEEASSLLLRRPYGHARTVEIFHNTQGLIEGRLYQEGQCIPLRLEGLPTRKITPGDLPKVQKWLNEVAIVIQGNRMTLWPRMLGGIDAKVLQFLHQIPSPPTPYEYVHLSSAAYKSEELHEAALLGRNPENSPLVLPPGWKVLAMADPTDDDYFGVAYVKENSKHIVISHRGTDPKKLGGLVADAEGIVGNWATSQQNSARNFAEKVMGKYSGYTFSCTGHSLGAWLAQICVFYHARELSAVTFDDPGCFDQLETLNKQRNAEEKVLLDFLDITNYLSKPNLINTCNRHVGTCYQLNPDLSSNLGPIEYTLQSHGLENIKKCFSPESGLPKEQRYVEHFPLIARNCLTFLGNFLAENEESSEAETHLLNQEASDFKVEGLSWKDLLSKAQQFLDPKALTSPQEALFRVKQLTLLANVLKRIQTEGTGKYHAFDPQHLPLRHLPPRIREYLQEGVNLQKFVHSFSAEEQPVIVALLKSYQLQGNSLTITDNDLSALDVRKAVEYFYRQRIIATLPSEAPLQEQEVKVFPLPAEKTIEVQKREGLQRLLQGLESGDICAYQIDLERTLTRYERELEKDRGRMGGARKDLLTLADLASEKSEYQQVFVRAMNALIDSLEKGIHDIGIGIGSTQSLLETYERLYEKILAQKKGMRTAIDIVLLEKYSRAFDLALKAINICYCMGAVSTYTQRGEDPIKKEALIKMTKEMSKIAGRSPNVQYHLSSIEEGTRLLKTDVSKLKATSEELWVLVSSVAKIVGLLVEKAPSVAKKGTEVVAKAGVALCQCSCGQLARGNFQWSGCGYRKHRDCERTHEFECDSKRSRSYWCRSKDSGNSKKTKRVVCSNLVRLDTC